MAETQEVLTANPVSMDWVPRPDPTRLTVEMLNREIVNLREIVFTRIDGMDGALRLANEKFAEKPTDAERIIENLR